MKRIKTLYLLSNKIKWKTFKLLQEKMVKQSGPTIQNFDKILWVMLRDKKLYCGFTDDLPENMWIGTKLPKNVIIKIITNPKPKK